ncbi:Uncharacterised protein [Mycobacteroides abscessus subsp. massiliense]|nr:Uncharacterised protein [Mycobacteroides abscessus subsp. abscessus]SKD61221.1 Uncharacterised protein [Mycobacteroides abscessus subsp. massiliense]SHZ92273.1 Uncharacterised protein [Mycobacteroides abscessus subsp. abscessus]SIE65777.1 Uncharacterised protein [Mycobacteroides abscessus subsp. abscessus]SIF75287.1 Uncharacterised protein [Mycobacteroides abscessus subsp. abscessus]
MVRRLLNFLQKPFLGLPDSVQPIVIRELEDMESILQDFTNHGFSVIALRPEHISPEPVYEDTMRYFLPGSYGGGYL